MTKKVSVKAQNAAKFKNVDALQARMVKEGYSIAVSAIRNHVTVTVLNTATKKSFGGSLGENDNITPEMLGEFYLKAVQATQ